MIILQAIYITVVRAIQGMWDAVLMTIETTRTYKALLQWARFVVEEYRERRDD